MSDSWVLTVFGSDAEVGKMRWSSATLPRTSMYKTFSSLLYCCTFCLKWKTSLLTGGRSFQLRKLKETSGIWLSTNRYKILKDLDWDRSQKTGSRQNESKCCWDAVVSLAQLQINNGNKHKKATYFFSVKRFDEELQWSLCGNKARSQQGSTDLHCPVVIIQLVCVCVEVSQGWRAPLRQVLLLSSHCHAKGTSCLHSAVTAEIFTTLFTRDTLTDSPHPPPQSTSFC